MQVCQGEELDLQTVPCVYGTYDHIQTSCQEALTQFNVTQGQLSTFQILGSNVVNIAESYLEFTLQLPFQGPNTNLWMHGSCVPMFRAVSFMPVGGSQVYMDQFHHWSKMATQYLLTAQQIKSMDNSNLIYASRVLPSANKLPANGFNASVAYDELQYAIPLDNGVQMTANTQALWFNVRLPFAECFAGTILSTFADLCLGQAVNIQFTWEDPSRWLWFNTNSPNDPSAGVPTALVSPTAAAATINTIQVQNLYLQVAIEKDPVLRQAAVDRYLQGYQLYVDNVQKIYQQNIPGNSQNINAPILNSGLGKRLRRIFVSPFNNVENINKALDNCNQAASPVTTTSTNRVTSFQVLLDSQPRQQKYITASPQVQSIIGATNQNSGGVGDFDRYKTYLEGSCVFTSGTLGLNWTFVDDYTARESRFKKYDSEIRKLDGLDLTLGDHTWQFLSLSGAAANYNWYVFAQTLKLMQVAPGMVSIN